jgi:hypothetical protein
MASSKLEKTMTTATSKKTFCFSAWVKRSGIGAIDNRVFQAQADASNYTLLRIDGDKLHLLDNKAGSANVNVKTNRVLRDTNAWYHIFVQVDTTQSTLSDQIKFYINGTRETSLVNAGYPGQNYEFPIGTSSYTAWVGGRSGTGDNLDGSLAHVHFVDGSAETSTTFGETDNTTGIWKPITSPSISEYGNNGFFLDFADSSNMGNDVSGKNNDYTVVGTITQTIDTPSNVFATGNPLYYYNGAYADWSNGNNTCYTGSGATGVNRATLGASAGKYYWEVKIGASNGAGNIWQAVGVIGEPQTSDTDELGDRSWGYGYWGQDGTIRNNDANIATYSTFTTNDIISVAMDLDNYKLYFAKNGTWQNSADPSAGTGGITLKANPTDGFYFPAWGDWDNTNRYYFYLNFGNGYFGTTAVASAGTNSGIGTFEYDVPSGYKALCTKNINAQEYD